MSTTMSNNESTGREQQSQQRHPAVPAFGTEIQDAAYTYKKSDSEKAPRYTVLPTGKSVNRTVIAGALTATEDRDSQAIAKVHTGEETQGATVRVSASTQYSPEMASRINQLEAPQNITVVGKFNQFAPEDSDQVYVDISPEAIGVMTPAERQRWVMASARATYDRIEKFNNTAAGDGQPSEGIQLARDEYDSLDLDKYRTAAQQAIDNVIL